MRRHRVVRRWLVRRERKGAFDPILNPTYLSPGVHDYTTITVPAGVTVYVGGAGPLSGTLDLHATGAIEIDGTINLSRRTRNAEHDYSQSTESGRAGGGGFTGEPYQTAALSAACQFVAGNPGSLGLAVSGSAGSCTVGSSTVCQSVNSPGAEISRLRQVITAGARACSRGIARTEAAAVDPRAERRARSARRTRGRPIAAGPRAAAAQ